MIRVYMAGALALAPAACTQPPPEAGPAARVSAPAEAVKASPRVSDRAPSPPKSAPAEPRGSSSSGAPAGSTTTGVEEGASSSTGAALPFVPADPSITGGPLALFDVGLCGEEETGYAPIACYDAGWITRPMRCLKRLRPGTSVTDKRGRRGVIQRALTPSEDDRERCLVVAKGRGGEWEGAFVTGPTMPTVDCARRGDAPTVHVTSEAVAAYRGMAHRRFKATRARLTDKTFTARDWLTVELDGDGAPDTLVSFAVDDGCNAVAARWGDGRPATLVFHSFGCPRGGDEDFLGDIPITMQRRCYDLDGDRRAEFVLEEGEETERSEHYVEWSGEAFATVGVTRRLGD